MFCYICLDIVFFIENSLKYRLHFLNSLLHRFHMVEVGRMAADSIRRLKKFVKRNAISLYVFMFLNLPKYIPQDFLEIQSIPV